MPAASTPLEDTDQTAYTAGYEQAPCDKQHDGKLTADGWTLDYETWQGVRTYDPAVGQWNTPDAFAGTVYDPIDFKAQTGHIDIANSHSQIGNFDLGKGQDNGSFVHVSGNVAKVHIDSRCGVCPSFSPAIHADLTVKKVGDSAIISGTRGLFPATEAYGYSNGQGQLILDLPESDDPIAGLTSTGPAQSMPTQPLVKPPL